MSNLTKEALSLGQRDKALLAETLLASIENTDADLEYSKAQCQIVIAECDAEDAFQDGLHTPARIAYNIGEDMGLRA